MASFMQEDFIHTQQLIGISRRNCTIFGEDKRCLPYRATV